MTLPSLDKMDDTLRKILSRPEFQPKGPTLLDRFLEWLWDLFEGLGRLFRGAGTGADWLGLLFILMVLGAIVFFVVLLVRRGQGHTQRQTRDALLQSAQSAAGLLARAQACAEAGDGLGAMICLLSSTLLRMRDMGLLTLETGRTNRQYLLDLRRAGRPEANLFGEFCRAFNRARFGGQSATVQDYLHWRRLLEEALYEGRLAG